MGEERGELGALDPKSQANFVSTSKSCYLMMELPRLCTAVITKHAKAIKSACSVFYIVRLTECIIDK